VKLCIEPAGVYQFLVSPSLGDATFVDHQYLVGISDRGEPVSDDQGSAPGQRGLKGLLQGGL
jgi:hypothetical protein